MTTTPLTRRRFLVATGCLSGGAALGVWGNRSALADEARPRWTVACRDAMLRSTGRKDCWAALQAIGAEGVEVEIAADLTLPGLFHPTTKYTLVTAAGREQLAADAKAAGQRITAFCMANRFEERPEAEIKCCGEVARAAQGLGVPAIRIDVAPVKLAGPEFLKLAVETLKKIMADTESTGVAFAIENHGTTTNDPRLSQRALREGRLEAARPDAGHGQFLLVWASPVEGLRIVRDLRPAGLSHPLQEHPLSGRRARKAAAHGLEVRRIYVPAGRGRHRLRPRRRDPAQGGLPQRSLHRGRVALLSQALGRRSDQAIGRRSAAPAGHSRQGFGPVNREVGMMNVSASFLRRARRLRC